MTDKSARGSTARILKMIHGLDRVVLPVYTLNGIVKSLMPFIILILGSMIIDGLEVGTPAGDLIQQVYIGVGIAFALSCASHLLAKYAYVHFTNTWYQLEFAKSKKSLSMDYQSIDSEDTNRIRQRMRDDRNWGDGIGSVISNYGGMAEQACLAVVAMIVTVPLLLSVSGSHNVVLTAAYIAGVVLITLLSILYARACQKKAWDGLASSTKESRVFWHFLGGGISYQQGKDVRIYGAETLIKDKGTLQNKTYLKNLMVRAAARFAGGSGVSAAVSGLIQGSAYLYVALQAVSGAIGIGEVFLYAGTIYQFTNGLSAFMTSANEFFLACGRMESTLAFFDIPNVMRRGTIPVEKRRDNDYLIEFRDVSFKYPGSGAYALKHLNLTLRVGERMAVVGQNGSGKTTMIKLLCRLYDPTEGEITLNGIDIRKYDYGEYLRIFAVVFQDFKLFAFPLGQNVSASIAFNEHAVNGALDKAGLSPRAEAMAMGLNTPLYKDFDEGGVEISGGEAQKIALARALYKNAPFIILDEPTAALDPIAEYEIYSTFDHIVGDKTAIYISHRLSSCRFCQDIAVFHEGELIQRGSHEALITDIGGKYYELWNAQAQYYVDSNDGDVQKS